MRLIFNQKQISWLNENICLLVFPFLSGYCALPHPLLYRKSTLSYQSKLGYTESSRNRSCDPKIFEMHALM